MQIRFFKDGGNYLNTTTSLDGDDLDQAWNIVQGIDPHWYSNFTGQGAANVTNIANRYHAVAPVVRQIQALALDSDKHFSLPQFKTNVGKYISGPVRWNGDSLHSSEIPRLVLGYIAANKGQMTPELQQALGLLASRALQQHASITSGGNGTDVGGFGYGTATNPYVGGQFKDVTSLYNINRGNGISNPVYEVTAESTDGNMGRKKVIRMGDDFYWFDDAGINDDIKNNTRVGGYFAGEDEFGKTYLPKHLKSIGKKIDRRLASLIITGSGGKVPSNYYSEKLGTNTLNLNSPVEKAAANFGKKKPAKECGGKLKKHENGGKLKKITF